MDPMRRVAAGAVERNLGPAPGMKKKVDLLRRLVAMRDQGGPRARIPEGRGDLRLRPPGPDRGAPGKAPGGGGPRRLPSFVREPGYRFGPPPRSRELRNGRRVWY